MMSDEKNKKEVSKTVEGKSMKNALIIGGLSIALVVGGGAI